MKRIFTIAMLGFLHLHTFAQYIAAQTYLKVNWDQKIMVSKSTPTMQVVTNALVRRGSPIHDGTFNAISNLGADMVRYAAWFPYPKLGVAELEPPTAGKTSWDFSLMDPITIDFMNATKGHPAIFEICTIPEWMFKTDKPVKYTDSPDSINWRYGGGTELRDPTLKEVSDYFARVVSWYHNGGFTDELGKYHKSGYHYAIPYWEILNEPELEHQIPMEKYVKIYDAIVKAIRKVSPGTKFVGMALAVPGSPHPFEYFLDHANHEPGIPLDMISYHFYAHAHDSQKIEDYPYALFDNADDFLNSVRFIDAIRKRESPATKVDLDELGTFVSQAMRAKPIPAAYWNLSGAVYAYLFVELSKMGIDVIGESQLVGYPGQFPDVSMIDWTNGKPNARYWVLKLIKDNFLPGDILVKTDAWAPNDSFKAQGFITRAGKKVLFINRENTTSTIRMPAELKGGKLYTVDMDSGENEPGQTAIADSIQLKPFAVAVAVAP
jgi:hypothetical protein